MEDTGPLSTKPQESKFAARENKDNYIGDTVFLQPTPIFRGHHNLCPGLFPQLEISPRGRRIPCSQPALHHEDCSMTAMSMMFFSLPVLIGRTHYHLGVPPMVLPVTLGNEVVRLHPWGNRLAESERHFGFLLQLPVAGEIDQPQAVDVVDHIVIDARWTDILPCCIMVRPMLHAIPEIDFPADLSRGGVKEKLVAKRASQFWRIFVFQMSLDVMGDPVALLVAAEEFGAPGESLKLAGHDDRVLAIVFAINASKGWM